MGDEQDFRDRLLECVNQTTIKGVIMSFVDVYQNRKHNALEVIEEFFLNHGPFLFDL